MLMQEMHRLHDAHGKVLLGLDAMFNNIEACNTLLKQQVIQLTLRQEVHMWMNCLVSLQFLQDRETALICCSSILVH